MDRESAVAAVVIHCIDELNRQLPATSRLSAAPETVLVGDSGVLDSLSLITLLVSVEQELSARLGVNASLLDAFMEDPDSEAMRSVGNLIGWIDASAKSSD